MTQDAKPGALDDVIGDIIPIVEAELFGQVSEEKEANAFVGGCKEAKRQRAPATYQLLARGVTFRAHMATLLQPVQPCLYLQGDPAKTQIGSKHTSAEQDSLSN